VLEQQEIAAAHFVLIDYKVEPERRRRRVDGKQRD
jgi:hypothetical protein